MTQRKNLSILLATALCLFSLGGFGLHWFVHIKSPSAAFAGNNFVPFVCGLLSALVIPWLFLSRPLLHLGYLLNGFTAIIGIITMAHFSIATGRTLLPDIVLCLSKLLLGKALFDLALLSPDPAALKHGRFFRYPSLGFWCVHLAVLSLVYYLGNLFGAS